MDPSQYVYAVVPSSHDRVLTERPGIGHAPVGAVSVGSIAALVSDAPEGRLRPSRANLTSHEEVVCSAHAVMPVLPFRFGTVMPDERAVCDQLLAPNEARFAEALEELTGKDEFRLRARYLPDVALRDVLQRSPRLRKLRDRTAGGGRLAIGDRIQLGELVFAELQRLREWDSSAIMQVLARHVVAWTILSDASDDVALYAACLVHRKSIPNWEAALGSLADSEVRRLRFEVVGPLPAWDFTDTHLEVA
jgi:hypothetical protein